MLTNKVKIPRKQNEAYHMSSENPNRNRLQVLSSHFTAMASEKEAALLAVPSDALTMYYFFPFMFPFSVSLALFIIVGFLKD